MYHSNVGNRLLAYTAQHSRDIFLYVQEFRCFKCVAFAYFCICLYVCRLLKSVEVVADFHEI